MADPDVHAAKVLESLPWKKVFDFCERLYGHLAVDVGFLDNDGDFQITTSKSQVQGFIGSELQSLFLEEGLAFEFREGLVQRRGRRHTVTRARAPRLSLATQGLRLRGVTTKRQSSSFETLRNRITKTQSRRLSVP